MEFDYTYEVIEKILLKRALQDKKYLNIMANVFDSRWFDKNRNNAIIMNLAIKYYKKYNSVPNNKILAALIKRYSEVHPDCNLNEVNDSLIAINSFDLSVTDECANRNIKKYIDEKAIYYLMSDNVQEALSTGDVGKILNNFEKIQKISYQDDDLGMDYFNKADMDKHWEYIKNPEAKLSTGWDGLDHVTHGGFLKDGRMLALFVGQAGLGKSLFLANIAVNFVKQGKSVVVVSLEMSQDVYAQRFDSVISEDNINGLQQTSESSRSKIEKFYEEHPTANLIIKEYPPKSIKVIDIETYLEKLVENGKKIDVIVIDYLNLVLPNTKIDNMYQSIMAVAEQLRSLSYKFHAPVISATQANRSGMNNEQIDLQNISESNGQAATADFIGMLYSMPEDREHGIINMRIAKNRFGAPGGVIPFKLNKASLKLEDQLFGGDDEGEGSEADQVLNNIPSLSNELNNL